jgi:hypothetical protein
VLEPFGEDLALTPIENQEEEEYFEDENAEYAKTISDRGAEMMDE